MVFQNQFSAIVLLVVHSPFTVRGTPWTHRKYGYRKSTAAAVLATIVARNGEREDHHGRNELVEIICGAAESRGRCFPGQLCLSVV